MSKSHTIKKILFTSCLMLGIALPQFGQCDGHGLRIIQPSGITQAVADGRYWNISGDAATGGSHDYSLAVLIAKAATADGHVVNRLFGDGRYAVLSGPIFTGVVLVSDGSSSAPSVGIASETGTGWWLVKAGRQGWTIDGTGTVMTLDATGLVVDGNVTFGDVIGDTATFAGSPITFNADVLFDFATDATFDTPGILRFVAVNGIQFANETEFEGTKGVNILPGAGVDSDLIHVAVAGGGKLRWITATTSFEFDKVLAVPNATAATHAVNRQTGDGRYVQTRSPIVVMLGGGTDPYFSTTNAAYTTAGIFLFGGTTELGTPFTIKAIGFKEANPTSWDWRLLDITNVTTIAEVTGNTGTAPEISTDGTPTNLPAGAAMFEIQIRRAGGIVADTVFTHSLNIEF